MKRLFVLLAVAVCVANTVCALSVKDFLRGGKGRAKIEERLERLIREHQSQIGEAKPVPIPAIKPPPSPLSNLIRKRRRHADPYRHFKEMQERLRRELEACLRVKAPERYRPLPHPVPDWRADFLLALRDLDTHTASTRSLQSLCDTIRVPAGATAEVSSERKLPQPRERLHAGVSALAASVTLQERFTAQSELLTAAASVDWPSEASAVAFASAVEGFGTALGPQLAAQAGKILEVDQSVVLLGKALGGLLDDEALPDVQALLREVAETGSERVKGELKERLLQEDWPSERCRDQLLEAVEAIGTDRALKVAHKASVITAAEFVRGAAGDSKVEQNVADAMAKYIEAVGMDGAAGGKTQLVADINKHITDEQTRREFLAAVDAVGKKGTDYFALGEQVAKGWVVEGLNRYEGWASEEEKQKAIAAIRNGEGIDWGSLGEVAVVQGRYLLAAQVSAMLHDKLGKKEAEALSAITDRLINAGTDAAFAEAKSQLKQFVGEYAPGGSATDVNAWIDSFGNDTLTEKQRDDLRNKALTSAAKGWGHDQIDKADHLTDAQKAAYKQQIDDQIDAGNYAGAMADIGRVAAGEFIEEKLGPDTGAAFDDIWDTFTDPNADLGDIAESLLDFGVVAGKNYLNKVAGEWVDGYLNRHPEIGKALAFFGINGEDIKAGISNVLNVLTDGNLDLKGKFMAIADLAMKALTKALTAALNNAINVVKQWLVEWTQKAIEKIVAVVAQVEAKINEFLRKFGSIVSVGFTDEVRQGLNLLRQGGLKAAAEGLDAFGNEATQLFEKAGKITSGSRKTADGREIGKVYEPTPEQLKKAKQSPYYKD